MPQLIWWWLATSIVITAIQPAVIGILPLERGIYHARNRIARPPIWQDLSQVGGDGHQNNYHWFSNQPNNIDWIQFSLITANQHRINSTIIPKIYSFIISSCFFIEIAKLQVYPIFRHTQMDGSENVGCLPISTKASTFLPTKTANQQKPECFLMEQATNMWIWMLPKLEDFKNAAR